MSYAVKIKNMKELLFKKANIFVFFIIFITFIIDRISKIKIINKINENVYFVNDFINFNLVWNTGIGFGLLNSNSPLIYNLTTFLIGSVILILLNVAFISENLEKLIYSIIIGGACGNFFDRLSYKAVPDFIDFHYNNFHWFTFNIADVFITLGIIVFIIRSFFVKY